MVGIRDIGRAVRHPRGAVRELHRWYYGLGQSEAWNEDGINIFEEDWDNLVILDACRYDSFRSAVPDGRFGGLLESRTSRGAATYEFVPGNFGGRKLHDVVYITANSWYLKLKDDIDSELHHVVDVSQHDLAERYYDNDSGALLPSAVTDYAVRAAEDFPHKRLLIHYPRPHHPFLGPFGKEAFPQTSSSLLEVLHQGEDVTPGKVRRAYRENLDIVLREINELLDTLAGRTVLSADHGEMLGERYALVPIRGYGHHRGIYNQYLVEVPWYIIDDGERRVIEAEKPLVKDDVDKTAVDERLEDLGYRIG
jgi:hypothetical protein